MNKFGFGGVKEWFLGEIDPEREKGTKEIKDHDVTDEMLESFASKKCLDESHYFTDSNTCECGKETFDVDSA